MQSSNQNNDSDIKMKYSINFGSLHMLQTPINAERGERGSGQNTEEDQFIDIAENITFQNNFNSEKQGNISMSFSKN